MSIRSYLHILHFLSSYNDYRGYAAYYRNQADNYSYRYRSPIGVSLYTCLIVPILPCVDAFYGKIRSFSVLKVAERLRVWTYLSVSYLDCEPQIFGRFRNAARVARPYGFSVHVEHVIFRCP